MSNSLEDLTAEERIYLKKMIQKQRNTKKNARWGGICFFIAGVGLIIAAFALPGDIVGAGSSPIAMPIAMVGGTCVLMGIPLLFIR